MSGRFSKVSSVFSESTKGHLKTKVNGSARSGQVKHNWTSKNCESTNHVLKQTVDWKTKGLAVL